MKKREYKTTEPQRKATKRYEEKNKLEKAYRSKKATTKNFILKTATDDDIKFVNDWIKDREENGIQK